MYQSVHRVGPHRFRYRYRIRNNSLRNSWNFLCYFSKIFAVLYSFHCFERWLLPPRASLVNADTQWRRGHSFTDTVTDCRGPKESKFELKCEVLGRIQSYSQTQSTGVYVSWSIKEGDGSQSACIDTVRRKQETFHPPPRSLYRKWTKWVSARLPDMTHSRSWDKTPKSKPTRGTSMKRPSAVGQQDTDSFSAHESSPTSLVSLCCTGCSNTYNYSTVKLHSSVYPQRSLPRGFGPLTSTFMCSHLSRGEMFSD